MKSKTMAFNCPADLAERINAHPQEKTKSETLRKLIEAGLDSFGGKTATETTPYHENVPHMAPSVLDCPHCGYTDYQTHCRKCAKPLRGDAA